MKQDMRLPRPQPWSQSSCYPGPPNNIWETATEIDKEGNKKILERVTFRLIEAIHLYSQLDLSGLASSQKIELMMCKNALVFTKEAVEKLNTLFEP